MKASESGHKDTAIALAEKGADLNIKDKVSDCYLCVYGDDDADDDDDDDAGVSSTLITAIYVYNIQLISFVPLGFFSSLACIFTLYDMLSFCPSHGS